MNRKRFRAIASLNFALILILDGAWQARAQDRQVPYPSMAPNAQHLMTDRNAEIALARSAAPDSISRDAEVIVLGQQGEDTRTPYPSVAPLEQYLIADRDAEITLARSAAPEAISRDAKILVLGRHGYETAVEGKNGFVCVVERGWMSPSNAPEFWNPKIRGPICFNPPAARSVLPTTYKRTEMVLAGRTKAEIIEGNRAAFEKGELPPLEPGAMSYMMSKRAYLTDDDDHNLAHLMFYAPPLEGKAWGADLPQSPVMLNPQFKGAQPIDVFVVPVGRWSDGSAAPVM